MPQARQFLITALILVGCDQSDGFDSDFSYESSADVHVDPSDNTGTIEQTESSALAAPEGPASIPVALVVGECPGSKRLIGALDTGVDDCALAGALPSAWSATRLFEAGSPGVAGLSGALPSELGRYCAYDYVGPEGQVGSHYASLTVAVDNYPAMDAATLSADCRGEFEQGNLYDSGVGVELREAMLANIGWDTGAAIMDEEGVEELRASIDVAVVDTVSQAAADDPNIDPLSPHGLQMAELIGEVDCPTGELACREAIRHVLAMPRNDWSAEPDWTLGGRHGSQGDLALGIYEAVEAWRERRLADPEASAPRLVLNLSVGWTGLAEEALESSRGPHAAVLAAARFASCHGALLIAAAGNADDELCPGDSVGPLAPARFEALAAPSEAQCAALGYAPAWTLDYPVFGAGLDDYRPLVHAVAGVDEYDEPLLNARTDSSSRLVALGSTGIVDPNAEVLAGSSVAAALSSGAAALVWSLRPELRADEVMELIYAAGWDTGRVADFGLPGPAESVHRLAVCPALAEACAGSSEQDCPTPTCGAQAPAVDGRLGGLGAAIDAIVDDPQTAVESYASAAIEEFPVCGGEIAGTTDLTSPQPDIPLCSRCNFGTGNFTTSADDSVSMTIDPSYAGMVVAVELITSDGETLSYRRLEPEVIESLNRQPDPVDVTRVSVDAPGALTAALRFELADGSTQTNTIPVYERPLTALE